MNRKLLFAPQNIRKYILCFLLTASIGYADKPIMPNLKLTLYNYTPTRWSLAQYPVVAGCLINSGLSTFQSVAPNNGVVTITATCSDPQFVSLRASYTNGESFAEWAVAVTGPTEQRPQMTDSFDNRGSKVNIQVKNPGEVCDPKVGCGYSIALFPAKMRTITLNIVGNFTRATVATYAQQIINNLSPAALSVFGVRTDKKSFSYALSDDNTTLTFTFTSVGNS